MGQNIERPEMIPATTGTVYILGAGFSKTCNISTDLEMLGALNPRLKTESAEDPRKTIDFLLEQSFHCETKVGFEYFMSTLYAEKDAIDIRVPCVSFMNCFVL